MPQRKRKIAAEEEQKPFFFDSFNVANLPVNSLVPSPEIIEIKCRKKAKTCSVKIRVPDNRHLVNLYFNINGVKRDMYYQVAPGIYRFRFTLTDQENFCEFYLTSGNGRSGSVYSKI